MQGRPALAVAGVDVGPGLQELLHHVPEVIDAALQAGWPEHQLRPAPCPNPHSADLVQGGQAVLIGQVRADSALEELADYKEGGVLSAAPQGPG